MESTLYTVNQTMQATPQNHNKLTLVFDQGSHASRIALFSETGHLIYLASKNISTQSPLQGHYEQDANEILDSLLLLMDELDKKHIPDIHNCSLCTQRSSVVAWNRQTGTPLSPLLSWRDLRKTERLETLKKTEPEIRQLTGLPLSGHYSASKMNWLLENNTQVKQAAEDQQLCIAPLASFLLFHLLEQKPFVLDHSNAQRSLLFDIHKLDWSDRLLNLFDINRQHLPQCQPVIHNYGQLKRLNIPMTAVSGDQNAALHAYPELQERTALINIGTGAFVLSYSPEKEKRSRLLCSIASSKNNIAQYVTEGTVNSAGNAISWALNSAPFDQATHNQDELFAQLPEWLEKTQSPPVFINTISGLGSPWWCNAGEPGFINALTQPLSACYVAIIESIIFLLYKNIQQLEHVPDNIFISGGLSSLNGLCQKLSDLTQTKVYRFEETESSARGSAWLANQLIPTSTNKLDCPEKKWEPLSVEKVFFPGHTPDLTNRYQQLVGELTKRCNNV